MQKTIRLTPARVDRQLAINSNILAAALGNKVLNLNAHFQKQLGVYQISNKAGEFISIKVSVRCERIV